MKYDIYLSPPNVGDVEKALVMDALDSGWVAPLGPHVDAFEQELADFVGAQNAVALSSGTAGLHLALVALGIKAGDEVIVPTMTFGATAFAISYIGAVPVFLDSETASWNLDPNALSEFLAMRASENNLPAAVIIVDVFGQMANYSELMSICNEYEILVIEDAAESLGSKYRDTSAGNFGSCGVFSFNGNKIMTTSGGGMVVSSDADLVSKIRYLATQARQPVPWYEHIDIGFNYRLSNILAAIGRGQLQRMPTILADRRAARGIYADYFESSDSTHIIQDAEWTSSNSWLSVAYFTDPALVENTRLRLAQVGIESRHVWKPLHLQPVFADHLFYGGNNAVTLFEHGLCLPSSNAEIAKTVIDRGFGNSVPHSGK